MPLQISKKRCIKVDPAAEIALHQAGRDADDRGGTVSTSPNRTEMRKP